MRSRSESEAVDLGDRGASLSESPDHPLAGHKLLPATTVSKVAGTPASRPSRSVPSRRGAGKPYFSATASAAAFVATWTGQIRLLGVRSTTADEESSGDLRVIHHGLSRHAGNEWL